MRRLNRKAVQNLVNSNIEISSVSVVDNNYIIEFYFKDFYRNVRVTEIKDIHKQIRNEIKQIGVE